MSEESQPQAAFSTPQLLTAMLKGRENVSDLIFSPGHAAQVELSGQLVELPFRGLERLLPHHTELIAKELLGAHAVAKQKLETEGSADLSFAVPSVARFRVNIFKQRGSYAIVMQIGRA